MNDLAIQTRAIVRRFGPRAAINGVDLSIPPGGIVALIGPNGAGKTTLLNLLAGMIAPTAGSAEILGHSTRQMPAELAPLIQVVGDRNEPPPSARIETLAALQREAAPRFDRQWFQQLLLDHELDPAARFGTLSKGQRRWVLVTLAIASLPRVLLMDEPADGLDPAARRRLYELLRKFVTAADATVLVSSHVLGDLERAADDVAILHRGRLLLHESLETLRDELREITLNYGEPAPAWLEQTYTLAEKTDGAARQRWFRPRGDAPPTLLAEVALHPAVRRVNLETLFLAITHADRPDESETPLVPEAQSCT